MTYDCAECGKYRSVRSRGVICGTCVKSTGKKNDHSTRHQLRADAREYATEVRDIVEATVLTGCMLLGYFGIALVYLAELLSKVRLKFKNDKFIVSIAVVSECWTRNGKRMG
jgi:hypothetical protein